MSKRTAPMREVLMIRIVVWVVIALSALIGSYLAQYADSADDVRHCTFKTVYQEAYGRDHHWDFNCD